MILFLNLPIKIAEILQMIAFLICLIASALTVKIVTNDNKYFKLFIASFLTFMLIFIVTHMYISIRYSQSFQWQSFFIWALIAVPSCTLLTYLVARKR